MSTPKKTAKAAPPRPTDAELAILRVLWKQGSVSVRQVLLEMNAGAPRETGYTTVLKMLQIMFAKGLVDRDDSVRPQIYRARLKEHETKRQLVRDLLDRAFGGSHRDLVLQALADGQVSPKEMAQIEALLARLDRSQR